MGVEARLLMADIHAYEAEVKRMRKKLERLGLRIERNKIELQGRVSPELNVPFRHIRFSKQICNASPTGTCVFNDYKDPGHKSCLTCGRAKSTNGT